MNRILVIYTLLTFVIYAISGGIRVNDGDDYCDKNSPAGSKCVAHLLDLRPTQFTIGQLEVDCKVKWMQTLSADELDAYIRKKPVPIWIGPGGLYMVDHHHLVRALYEADLGLKNKKKYVIAEVVGNLIDLTNRANFLQSMVSKGKIWLYDEQGNNPLNPEFLPDTVEVLANDPHRSLSWLVITFGGSGKSDVRYAQFQWAEYFRKAEIFPVGCQKPYHGRGAKKPPTVWSWCEAHPYSPLDCYLNQNADIFHRALPIAMLMANSTDASYLPGFGPTGEVTEPKCDWDFFDDNLKSTDDALAFLDKKIQKLIETGSPLLAYEE